jgi:hypothetical protein
MRIPSDDIAVEFVDQSRIKATWTGIAGYASWVYVNGKLLANAAYSGTAREFTATVDQSKPVYVEVHELPSTETQYAPCEPPNEDPPTIYWLPVAAADRYNIQGRHESSAASQSLKYVEKRFDNAYYQELVPNDILRDGGCYWWYKVDAISQYGISSAASEWPYFEMGMPPLPYSATIERVGSGPSATMKLTLIVN